METPPSVLLTASHFKGMGQGKVEGSGHIMRCGLAFSAEEATSFLEGTSKFLLQGVSNNIHHPGHVNQTGLKPRLFGH